MESSLDHCALVGINPAGPGAQGGLGKAGAACAGLEITRGSRSSSVLGQMAPAAPKVTAQPSWVLFMVFN